MTQPITFPLSEWTEPPETAEPIQYMIGRQVHMKAQAHGDYFNEIGLPNPPSREEYQAACDAADKTGVFRFGPQSTLHIHPDDLPTVQRCHQIRHAYGWNAHLMYTRDKLPPIEKVNELMMAMGLPCIVLDPTVARGQAVWEPEKP